PGLPGLQRLALADLLGDEAVGLREVLPRDGGLDELAGDLRGARRELDGRRNLRDVVDRLVRERRRRALAGVRPDDPGGDRTADDEDGDDPRQGLLPARPVLDLRMKDALDVGAHRIVSEETDSAPAR